jgi:hypothetical protein
LVDATELIAILREYLGQIRMVGGITPIAMDEEDNTFPLLSNLYRVAIVLKLGTPRLKLDGVHAGGARPLNTFEVYELVFVFPFFK